jgi:CDGSH-type Zn-finger protein
VISGTGKTVNRVAECWLCRCGQSGKKPYCDGTHKRIGFRSGA